MEANGPCRLICLLAVFPVLLSAQFARQHDTVALKHWSAPLFWQPAFEPAVASSPNATALPMNANPLVFVAMPPCRVVDTRTTGQGFTGAFGPPFLAGGASRTVPILSSPNCALPVIAQAYSLDITVVPPARLAYVTVFPTGQPSPVAAVAVESPQGALASSVGIVPAGTNGSIDIYASDATDVVVDVNGYYAAITDAARNTTLGVGALASNTTGGNNTAVGDQSLGTNTTGASNTAAGNVALSSNTTGSFNTAIGEGALEKNTTGNYNAALGLRALRSNTTGIYNTAVGTVALDNNRTGSYNIAIGDQAGILGPTDADGNIYIGSGGNANDSHVVRIGGTGGPVSAFLVQGVRGVTTRNNDAIPVMIDSAGQLGTVSSSRRFKEDIQEMGDASGGLMQLRPVTFRYQKPFADGAKPIQYGLIAEEVEEVYPDLVARSADGQIETVKYQVLDAMLLNELQKEHRTAQHQAETIRLLESRLAAMENALLSGK